MVAKIGRGKNLIGALSYNHHKVEKEKGKVLFTQKMIESPDGSYTVAQLSRSFEPYLLANRRTEKPVLHISLNPGPKDAVSDTDYTNIAQDYMQQMGYGEQPFVVFKHTDIDRTHIHIVSVCVDEEGRKISDTFEKMRSMDVCRALEKEYNLTVATEQKQKQRSQVFRPVNYNAGDVKSQMASVLRHLPKYYQFQSFGGYNALLSLFNITAEEVKGENNGIAKQGIVYFALNEQGEKASNPFKASLFGKGAGYTQLQSFNGQSSIQLKNSPAKGNIKDKIEAVIHFASNEAEFKKLLSEQGINIVVRRNVERRIYGMTFIDHESRSVWNGSQLGKNLSANVFNDWWNNGNKPQQPAQDNKDFKNDTIEKEGMNQHHNPFEFFGKVDKHHANEESNLIEAFGGLLPQAQGEDFEETAFANRMKKKKRRKL
jgi:hypothetical protein